MTTRDPHDAALPHSGLVKFAAAKLERYERERAAAATQEHGWPIPPDPDTIAMVEALRGLAQQLDPPPDTVVIAPSVDLAGDTEVQSDLRSAARAVRSQSWPLDMRGWADQLADRLDGYARHATTVAPPAPTPEEVAELDRLYTETGERLLRIVAENWGSDFTNPEVGGCMAECAYMDAAELAAWLAEHISEMFDEAAGSSPAGARSEAGEGANQPSNFTDTPNPAPNTPEDKLIDLMANLERSVTEAKAERDRLAATHQTDQQPQTNQE